MPAATRTDTGQVGRDRWVMRPVIWSTSDWKSPGVIPSLEHRQNGSWGTLLRFQSARDLTSDPWGTVLYRQHRGHVDPWFSDSSSHFEYNSSGPGLKAGFGGDLLIALFSRVKWSDTLLLVHFKRFQALFQQIKPGFPVLVRHPDAGWGPFHKKGLISSVRVGAFAPQLHQAVISTET